MTTEGTNTTDTLKDDDPKPGMHRVTYDIPINPPEPKPLLDRVFANAHHYLITIDEQIERLSAEAVLIQEAQLRETIEPSVLNGDIQKQIRIAHLKHKYMAVTEATEALHVVATALRAVRQFLSPYVDLGT